MSTTKETCQAYRHERDENIYSACFAKKKKKRKRDTSSQWSSLGGIFIKTTSFIQINIYFLPINREDFEIILLKLYNSYIVTHRTGLIPGQFFLLRLVRLRGLVFRNI